jgi:hypothetical protein
VRPYLEKTQYKKRAGGVPQGVDPEFKPLYYQKKNKNKKLLSAYICYSRPCGL